MGRTEWDRRAERVRETLETPGWKDIEAVIDAKIESFRGLLDDCPLNAVLIVRGKIKVLQMIKYKVNKISKDSEELERSK